MRSGKWKSIVSYILALLMVLTVIPKTSLQVDAATKPSLSALQITLAKGMTQALKLKNLKQGSQVKWSSKNKEIATISSNGVVKGVKDGKTAVNCIVDFGGKRTCLKCMVTVKTPRFEEDTCTICRGESLSLGLKNKYGKATYKWTVQNEQIAKVNHKGRVTGVEIGETTVVVKILIPKTGTRSKKVITEKMKIIVIDAGLVTNQEELNHALLNKTVKKIIIKTDNKVALTIPQGDYKLVELIVDAPEADIINDGIFKNITIKRIASDTWTERAKGNVLILDASAGHVVIPDTAYISEIRITNVNSSFKLDVYGSVDKIAIDSPTKIDIKIAGTVGTVDVNSRATISVDGSSSAPIIIKVAEGADGTTLNSNVKVDVTSASDTEINLSKGAEGSVVQTTNEKKSVEVTNNTSAKIEIKNEAGKNQTVESGKNVTVDGTGIVKDLTNNGSSSSGSSSSGNLTRIISYFDSIPTITAGTSGETLKTVAQIKALLPIQVTANDIKGGKFNIQVTDWVNENGYSENSSAGNYTFSAVLGSSSVTFLNPDNKKATVRIHVKANTEIELGNNNYLEVIPYVSSDNIGEWEDANGVYYAIKNNSDKVIQINGQVKCYDANNYLVTNATLSDSFDARHLSPGQTGLFRADLDYNVEYDRCYLDLTDSREDISWNKESAWESIKVESEKKADSVSVKLTNVSDRQIGSVDVGVLFLNSNGEVLCCRYDRSNKVYGVGYTDTMTINYPIRSWKDEKGVWQETVVEPASCLVYISNAYFTSNEEILDENKIPSYLEVVPYVSSDNIGEWEDANGIYYAIKNNSDKVIEINGQVKCYDANNYLVTNATLSDSFDARHLSPGQTGLFRADLDYNVEYDRCYLDLTDSREDISWNKESAWESIKVESEKKADSVSVKLTNVSDRQIGSVDVGVLFLNSNGEVLCCRYDRSNKVYGVGYTDTMTINYPIRSWKDEKGVWQETVVEPASCLVYISNAYFTSNEEILDENKIPSYLEVVPYVSSDNIGEWEDANGIYYAIKNNSDKVIEINGQVKCYDANNYLVTNATLSDSFDARHLSPGQTGLFRADLDYNVEYDRCYLDLTDSREDISWNKESAWESIKVESEKKADSVSVKLTNVSDRQIGSVDVGVLFLNSNGEVLCCRYDRSNKVYGVGYTDTMTINYPIRYWKDEKGVWQETVVEPASYLIYISSVYYTND